MSLDHQALAATVLGMVAIVVLGLAALGAGVAVRMVLDFARVLRAERAWLRATQTAPLPADDEDGWTALADAVHEAPQAQPGSNDWLYEMHPDAPSWEDQ